MPAVACGVMLAAMLGAVRPIEIAITPKSDSDLRSWLFPGDFPSAALATNASLPRPVPLTASHPETGGAQQDPISTNPIDLIYIVETVARRDA